MNINDLDTKEFSNAISSNYFMDELSPFLEFREEVEKLSVNINQTVIWTYDDDKKFIDSQDLYRKNIVNVPIKQMKK